MTFLLATAIIQNVCYLESLNIATRGHSHTVISNTVARRHQEHSETAHLCIEYDKKQK